ncbi:MAG: hypothetical protein ABDH32_00195 [Candidatus Caldarchaeales archaeon]
MSKTVDLSFSRIGTSVRAAQKKSIIKIIEAGPELVKLVEDADDTVIDCKISKGPREFWKIDTGIKLLDKLIHIISYYSRFNIELIVNYKSGKPSYKIVEASGRVLGRTFRVIADERSRRYGIYGYGYGQGIFKEAVSESRISLESGAGCWISRSGAIKVFGRVEELPEESIKLFFEEFSKELNGTIHLDLVRAESPHNLWISAFMAFGEALRQVFREDEWSKK